MNINVCFTPSDNYAVHMAVTITSILKNAGIDDEFSFYVLDSGISDFNKNKIAELKKIKDFNIQYVKLDTSVLDKLPIVLSHFTTAIYYRFMMADLLPDIEKVIYLDCDIVVCSSIKKLFEEDISGYYIAAIEDIGSYYNHLVLKPEFEKLQINSGVMVVNLGLWRKDGLGAKLIKFAIETKEELPFGDQDVINKNLKCKRLDFKWNVQSFPAFHVYNNIVFHPLKDEIIEAVINPLIIHYITKCKPWNCDVPFGHLYIKYKQMTPFRDKSSKVIFKQLKYFILRCREAFKFVVFPAFIIYRSNGWLKISLFNIIELKIFPSKKSMK
ncbi:MAG: glycosyltransferase family 8 protein [Endomicrobiaceae bacterium]|nr:glycosyltransferase family 8 protein [Endomicrobiaceae bacterium]